MDKNFFEFWGQMFTNMARGQKQYDDLQKWMQQGMDGCKALTSMFKKAYGLEGIEEGNPEFLQMWKKSVDEVQKSFADMLNIAGVVPKEEHLKLIKKYEELKEKVRDLEETNKNLKSLLGDKGSEKEEVVDNFRDLIDKQSTEFQDIMSQLSTFFQQKTKNNQNS